MIQNKKIDQKRPKCRGRIVGYPFFFIAIAMLFLNIHPVFGADESSGGVKKAGVIFNIAADRRVEKIGGVVQPEPLDQYLARLFTALSEQIQTLDEKVVRLQEDVSELKKHQEKDA
ncbi:MAG: hypothetical protein H6757_05750 [Candidatus Omnitrophica bacterium]|nr:hypothetical protein [Candidatus Omnitrophota bacterium]